MAPLMRSGEAGPDPRAAGARDRSGAPHAFAASGLQTARVSHCRGWAYLSVLFLVTLLALVASASLQAGTALARRNAEQELLAIGNEFQQALRSYAGAPLESPTAPELMGLRGPRTLEELLRDPRAPGIRRHLRRIYADPLTGRPDWGLVRDRDGLIVGVYSLAPGRPIRQAGFDATWAHFENSESYQDWIFGLKAVRDGRRS
jgi:hypothetical protein